MDIKKAFPKVKEETEPEIKEDIAKVIVKNDDYDDILATLINEGKEDHDNLRFFYGGVSKKFKNKVTQFDLVQNYLHLFKNATKR